MNYLWVSILKVHYPDTSCIRAVSRDNYDFIRFSVDYSSGFYIISLKNILLYRMKYGMKTNKTCFTDHTSHFLSTLNTQINKFYFYNLSLSLRLRRALVCLLFNVSSRNSKRIANISCIDEGVYPQHQTGNPVLISNT